MKGNNFLIIFRWPRDINLSIYGLNIDEESESDTEVGTELDQIGILKQPDSGIHEDNPFILNEDTMRRRSTAKFGGPSKAMSHKPT